MEIKARRAPGWCKLLNNAPWLASIGLGLLQYCQAELWGAVGGVREGLVEVCSRWGSWLAFGNQVPLQGASMQGWWARGGGSTSGKEFGVVWRWGFPLQCLAGCVYTEPGAMVCSQQISQMVEPLWRVVLVWELIIKLFSQAVRSVVAVGSVGLSPVIPTQTSSVVLDRGSDLVAC